MYKKGRQKDLTKPSLKKINQDKNQSEDIF